MIILKTAEELELISRAGQIVAECQKVLIRELKPGMTTLDLDSLTETYIRDLGGIPAFKGYRDYPRSLCASINDEVVHGIPSQRVLNEGDIIGVGRRSYSGRFLWRWRGDRFSGGSSTAYS